MKIRNFTISNLGGIREVNFDELSDIVVLVGKNGSGKTFLFSGLKLFFDEFSITGGESTVKDDDYLWHRRLTENPIRIDITLDLSKREFRNFGKLLGLSKEDIESGVNQLPGTLRIIRELIFNSGWRTANLQLGSFQIIEDDQVVKDLGIKETSKPLDLSRWHLYIFDPSASPSNITGARLLVDEENRIAYHSNPEFDDLVSRGLKLSLDHQGKNYQEWASEQGYQLIERIPNPNEAEDLYEALNISKEQPPKPTIDPKFSQNIRSIFKFVPAARDSQEYKTFRPPLLDQSDSFEMRDLSLSRRLADETKWGEFGNDVATFLSKRMEPNPDDLLIVDKGLRLPLAQLGSGEQSIVALEWNLLGGYQIFAIEDPENHLHPDLIRKTFHHFKKLSSKTQIFIATHSHLIIDKEVYSNNWMVFIETRETKVKRCQNNNDLRDILLELGVMPSDIYFRDLVIFVEGGTEKEAVIPIWAETLGLNLIDNLNVGLIAIGGDSKLESNLRIWLEIARHAPIDYLVVLDSHARDIATQMNNEMGVPMERFCILSEHAIEDYYPPRYIVEALKSLFDLEIDSKEVHKKEGESRARTIQSVLERSGKLEHGWKVSLGAYVAKRMKASEIDQDIRAVIERIRDLLG